MGISVLQGIIAVFRPLPGVQRLANYSGARIISKKYSSLYLCAKT